MDRECQSDKQARVPFSRLDGLLSRLHRGLIKKYPIACMALATALYAALVLVLGDRLAISSNYAVILPVLMAALCFELPGGIVAGFLGLPANLLLFAILGHPEFSPASKPIAELSGIVVGTASGFLSEYFSKLEAEIETRIATEEALRDALASRELLLQELNHRVKNNLNVIKSLAQLQRNRSEDPDFLAAVDDLVGRIFSISLVHEQLYGSKEPASVDAGAYISNLAANVVSGFARREPPVRLECSVARPGMRISADHATPLGLIANEVLTNALRHAFRDGAEPGSPQPAISVRFLDEGGDYLLVIEDNGRGFSEVDPKGLGTKIIKALCDQLLGRMKLEPLARIGSADSGVADGARAICDSHRNDITGTRFELRFSSRT
jgi:two-component sensor histidine kinase